MNERSELIISAPGVAADAPWVLADVRSIARSAALGLGMLVVGWWGASGTPRQDRQIAWLVVAILGIVVLGIGSFLWLLAGRRALGTRRAVVMDALATRLAAATGEEATTVDEPLVAVAGTVRYHRPDCQLVTGKDIRAATLAAHRRVRRRPCEMCEPAS